MRLEAWNGPRLRDRNKAFNEESAMISKEMDKNAEALVRLRIQKESKAIWRKTAVAMLDRIKSKSNGKEKRRA